MSSGWPVIGARACSVLYNLLVARSDRRPFLLPANICPIVPITFFKAKMPFELADLSPRTLHMDLDHALVRAQRGALGGVLFAHTYGDRSTPHEALSALKHADPSLLLIDDRCLCTPDLERPSSNPADVVLYSTGHAKQVELGFGGYAFVNDDVDFIASSLPFAAADLATIEAAYKHSLATGLPFEYRDSDWLELTHSEVTSWSELAGSIRKKANEARIHRDLLNEIYASRLPEQLQLPPQFQSWRFNVRVKDKPEVLAKIFAAGLFASSHYASLGGGIMGSGHFPVAETLADSVLNLFNDHHFTPDMAERVAAIIVASQ